MRLRGNFQYLTSRECCNHYYPHPFAPQPNCRGKFYNGYYGNGAFQTDFRRRRRSADATEAPHFKEEIINVFYVASSRVGIETELLGKQLPSIPQSRFAMLIRFWHPREMRNPSKRSRSMIMRIYIPEIGMSDVNFFSDMTIGLSA